MQNVTEIKQSL